MQNELEVTCRWYDSSHPPTEAGLYYWETCDHRGDPREGFFVINEGVIPRYPELPSKFFGPIKGALKRWPMTASK